MEFAEGTRFEVYSAGDGGGGGGRAAAEVTVVAVDNNEKVDKDQLVEDKKKRVLNMEMVMKLTMDLEMMVPSLDLLSSES